MDPEEECSYLLTGATGLVGRYLMSGLLRRGCDLAVLVRGSSRHPASRRVEQAIQPFETARLLPRPRVIQGDLSTLEISALDEECIDWLTSRRLKVIHCAASIRFVEDREHEPYRTNVTGTENLLALCKHLDCHEFHHVSTAYVGCRVDQTLVRERPIDDLDAGGNDYEASKIRAERLVRDSSHLRRHIIHRPSIVIGDSSTGYTSTFHGFYAPLQIGAQFAKEFGVHPEAADWFRGGLGITRQDSKNLVPVDWVAESIVQVAFESTVASESILHWTNPDPIPCEVVQAAIHDAIAEKFPMGRPSAISSELPTSDIFRQQMQVYESYFGSDPAFDSSHAQASCPTLPCPEVSYESLLQTARFALDNNFGWPRPSLPELPHQELVGAIRRKAVLDAPMRGARLLELRALGPGSPETLTYALVNERWHLCNLPSKHSQLRLTVPLELLINCISGTSEIVQLIEDGQAAIDGSNTQEWRTTVAKWVNDVKSDVQPG